MAVRRGVHEQSSLRCRCTPRQGCSHASPGDHRVEDQGMSQARNRLGLVPM